MKIKSMLIMIFILTISSIALAGYVGPATVIEGRWGSGDLDFGFESGDTMDSFPGLIYADKLGNIIIGDGVNFRIKIYNPEGIWQRNFTYKEITVPSIGGWPANLRVKAGVGIFSIYKKLQKYDYYGNLVWAIDVPGTRDFWVEDDGSILLQEGRKKYLKYSPNGQLLETYKERPLELGLVKKLRKAEGYIYIIQYPDLSDSRNTKTYTLKLPGYIEKIKRDNNGSLYATALSPGEHTNDSIFRYDPCKESIAKMQIPDSQYNITYITDKPHPIGYETEVIVEYGKPVIAPNGDVYTWKRTKDTYSIIKWIWIESRDAPVNLKAAVSKDKIALTWEKPAQNAGMVTGYEIYRSPDICGPFNKIKKVKKDVLHYTDKKAKEGETYYYQVCAERGSGYSGYSNKAVGSIKD